MLAGLNNASRSIEFRRVVYREKGRDLVEGYEGSKMILFRDFEMKERIDCIKITNYGEAQ